MDTANAWIALVLVSCVLVTAAVTDWRSGRIPNWLTLPGMAGGLTLAMIVGFVESGAPGVAERLAQSGLALAAGLVPFAVLFLLGGLGGGDAKLMGAVGAISADWHCVVDTMLYGLLLTTAMAIFLMIRHRIVKRTLGRILSAALSTAAKVKPQIPDDSPRVPMAAAICVGGILAAVENLLHVPVPWAGLGV